MKKIVLYACNCILLMTMLSSSPIPDSKGDKLKVEKADLTSLLPGTPSKGNSGKKNSKENDKSSVNDDIKVLCGRLNIVLDGDSTDIDAFAEELTKTFPHSEIEIVGFDRRVGVLQLRVPNEKRTIIKSEIEKKLGDWGVLVTEVYLENSYSTGKGVAVDLGLSVKWAACNLGATKPEEYGNYYAWGETEPKTTYTENCKWCGVDYDVLKSQGVINSRGNLTSRYDAATANWGAGWRMPTLDEIKELQNHCRWISTFMNGVRGYKVTGPSGRSIFLPAAGNRYGYGAHIYGFGGYYWSSSAHAENNISAYRFEFYSNHFLWNSYSRFRGLSVPLSQNKVPQISCLEKSMWSWSRVCSSMW
ncbi:MAG: hypothetical protein MJZ24_00425 [Paludibacteraceae bacterium]|nr:hypothetical protein [Paludibacteraceae bacterium]